MSRRKAFEDEWEARFPDTPIPDEFVGTDLSFLDDEGVSSLAKALDSSESAIQKLEDELSRQQFVHDFVLQQLNVSITARSDYAARRNKSLSRRGLAASERKTPVTKTPSAPRPNHGQPARGHGKPSQLAAVMAKFGIGKVNRPAIDPEDEGRLRSLDDSNKMATPLSRFYDRSNMYRASSEPSLLDCNRKYKPQPAIPPTAANRMPPGFKPVFTKEEHSKLSPSLSASTTVNRHHRPESAFSASAVRSSSGPELDYGRSQHIDEPMHAGTYLETNLDSIIPPASTPPPPVDRFELVEFDDIDDVGLRPARHHNDQSHIYDEPMAYQREITSRYTENDVDDDEAVSSDEEEPLYFNMLKFKEQSLNLANALYMSRDEMTSSDSGEREREASRRSRRMAHHYQYIEPQLSMSLTIPADTDSGKQKRFFLLHTQILLVLTCSTGRPSDFID